MLIVGVEIYKGLKAQSRLLMDILGHFGYSCKNPQKVLFGALCALLLTTDCTSVDVSSSQFGKFDFTELDEILYDFELSPQPVSDQDVERTSGVRGRNRPL